MNNIDASIIKEEYDTYVEVWVNSIKNGMIVSHKLIIEMLKSSNERYSALAYEIYDTAGAARPLNILDSNKYVFLYAGEQTINRICTCCRDKYINVRL
jgi:hypothetical protein